MATRKNIFCLEGEWDASLKSRNSILPTLEFMEHSYYKVKYVFRKVALQDDLFFYLHKALRSKFNTYSIINLAFHGESQKIHMANGFKIKLSEIAKEFEVAFENKIIHFGSCSTLRTNSKTLHKFMDDTGALLVSGYTRNIDFIDSSLFDIAYFTLLQKYDRLSYIDNKLQKDYTCLVDRLGFYLLHQNKVLVA
ncbi:DUF6642 family protein [Cesiribacter sp. SM1]|uniref:DUF6642 family protein n=1 Tax=Cesiribacter sp. SM1 TaxID=2861196 RepID=UPI001CD53F23|nr:DUF6642 family protein [Cesiribacter sp. SM1]